ncbi:MAG: hypothetical protein IT440_04710 [Phycisphaeraceae bacterium]|nr:hypothetical protein [Phycisphaeraceae bacterium]
MSAETFRVCVAAASWLFNGNGPYTGQTDFRGLMQIHHPWVTSAEGHQGAWRAHVSLPPDLAKAQRVYLSFYQSDNYHGSHRDEHDWLGVQAFNGHRFKQLLVDGQVVWEQDVATDEWLEPVQPATVDEQAEPAFRDGCVVLTLEPRGRKELDLEFRMIDRVASTTRLPDDMFWPYSWSTQDPARIASHFQTNAFFGDVALSLSDQPYRPSPRTWQAPNAATTQTKQPEAVTLNLWTPGDLPAAGYPVRCGVPMPEGCCPAGTKIRLERADGEAVPVVITETSHWPDGSVRWLLCEFVASGPGSYRLRLGQPGVAPASPVRVERGEQGLTIENGTLSIRLGNEQGEGLFEQITRDGLRMAGPCRLSMKLNRVGWLEAFVGDRRTITVEREDAVRVVLRLDGEMRSKEGTRLGPWQARVQVWAGLPYVLVDWRVVNESDQSMAMLLDWSAQMEMPKQPGATADFGAFEPITDEQWAKESWSRAGGGKPMKADPRAMRVVDNIDLLCRQEQADLAMTYHATLPVGMASRAPGYVRLSGNEVSLVASMRWFAEEYPKGIWIRSDKLALCTLPEALEAMTWRHDVPFVRLGRGESKRQTFALWFEHQAISAGQADAFNACVQDAPRLCDRTWFLDCGALETGPAQLPAGVDDTLAPHLAASGIDIPRLGHREYWDTAWMNGYRGRAHAGLLRHLITGDPRWLRYFDAACRHNADVDLIRYCPEHPDWVGSIHQYSADHTSGVATGNIGLNTDDQLEHYLLTGDPDSLEAARGLSEHVLQCYSFARSARAVGWPLSQVSRWYDETDDPRFLAKSRELLQAARAFIEPRRGIFEDRHGVWNYQGAVPFMTAYLGHGLIRCHRATGNPEALRLLCLLVDGLLAECSPQPGMFVYSPNPENNLNMGRPATARWTTNIGGMCGYAWLQTGNPAYLQGMRDCRDAILAHPDDVSLDMVETLGWIYAASAASGQ